MRRDEVGDAPVSLADAIIFATLQEVEKYLEFSLVTGVIEDLANVNVNYAINLLGFQGSSFTLRLQTAAVPIPATLPLLISAFGLAGVMIRKRRA